jgi:REP element-mobilizing transposase RayT
MRIARYTEPALCHHIISRFVDREWFFREREERENYLRLLGRAVLESDWLCLAYALMSNHIHLALIAGTSTLESWIKRVNGPFAHWMNRRHGRLGPMFAHRPKSPGIEPSDEGRVIAYVHNNPVNAGVVARARDSDWTSHAAYAGLVEPPRWLSRDVGLARSGFADDPNGFDAWVDGQAGDEMPELELETIRRAVRRRGALELATPRLSSPPVVPLVARPFAHLRPDPRRLMKIVADVLGLEIGVLCSGRRDPRATSGRHVAVHSGKSLGMVGSQIAAALGISEQAVSRIGRIPLDETLRTVCAVVVGRASAELPMAVRPR